MTAASKEDEQDQKDELIRLIMGAESAYALHAFRRQAVYAAINIQPRNKIELLSIMPGNVRSFDELFEEVTCRRTSCGGHILGLDRPSSSYMYSGGDSDCAAAAAAAVGCHGCECECGCWCECGHCGQWKSSAPLE